MPLCGTYSRIWYLLQVWVCVYSRRLLFSESIPTSTSENRFIADHYGQSCKGYLDLTDKSDVKLKNGDRSSMNLSTVSSATKKFPFQVKDGFTSVTLAAESEAERESWVETIRQAIAGTNHELSSTALTFPSFASSMSNGSQSSWGVDFPHKTGFLKKTSTGNATFGIKITKKRFFRLEGGEVRYYEDEDIRPTKLKGVLSLEGARVSGDSTSTFTLSLATRDMKLEAPSPKEAEEWRDALGGTITLLSMQKKSGTGKPPRRQNLHEKLTSEQKKALGAPPRGAGGGGAAASSA
ncbi:hypothetical protein EON65_47155, partial [archaeon]